MNCCRSAAEQSDDDFHRHVQTARLLQRQKAEVPAEALGVLTRLLLQVTIKRCTDKTRVPAESA